MTVGTVAEIEAALGENREAPAGPARSARAEQLVELAAQAGDGPLTVRALQELIRAYEYGGERDKVLVPFARLVTAWDERPDDFDHAAAYYLHWHFKWVTGGMIAHPNVPLATMHRWLDEMAVRYRTAGYQLQAVHAYRHYVAAHVGDRDAAQRAFDAWLAADRDAMSDCHACDRRGQGEWNLLRGDDAAALGAWEPVLDGALSCEEEPHRTLALSLLPLVRLGRLADARANHLRGYRLARGNPNLRQAVGHHLEFAALTGNETRGLAILAEHASWLSPSGENAVDRLGLLEGVAVLLRRLAVLGRTDAVVPGAGGGGSVGDLLPAVEREIAEIAARFDRRNGTTAVSDRSRERLGREPSRHPVVLGVAGPPLAPAVAAASPDPAVAPDPVGAGLDELVAEAESCSERYHPGAEAAWRRVAGRARATGEDLPPAVAARLAEERALAGAGTGDGDDRAAFLAVAERYAALGEPARAAVSRARAGLAATLAGDPGTGGREVADAVAALDELSRSGCATARQLLAARLCQGREALHRWLTDPAGPDPDSPVRAALLAHLSETVRLAERQDRPYQAASGRLLLAHATLVAGAPGEAEELLGRAVDGYLAAEAPWEAAVPLAILSELALDRGDPVAAEEHARTGLRHGGALLRPELSGGLTRMVAEACWYQGDRDAEVVDQALTAAQRLDAAAVAGRTDPVLAERAAQARLRAALAFHRLGKPAEAAALFEAALPGIERYGDEYDTVQARRGYGMCLSDLGEHRAAAQVLLGAATIAQGWPDQTGHASLAHAAGAALESAGMVGEAGEAFQRAADLWRDLGRVPARIRALRARAWTLVELAEPDPAGALALMTEATAVAAAPGAPAAEDPDPESAVEIEYERYETLLQTSGLLLRHPEAVAGSNGSAGPDGSVGAVRRALSAAGSAVEGFTRLGAAGKAAEAQFVAAECEAFDESLGGYGAATARIGALRLASLDRGDTAAVEQCDRYLAWLDRQSAGARGASRRVEA